VGALSVRPQSAGGQPSPPVTAAQPRGRPLVGSSPGGHVCGPHAGSVHQHRDGVRQPATRPTARPVPARTCGGGGGPPPSRQDAEALILDVESRALRCPTYAAHFVLPLEIGRPPEHVDVRPLDERGQHVVQVTGGSVVAVQDLESRGALVEHRGDGLTHAPGTLMDRHDDREGGCCQTLGMGLLALEQQRSSNVPQLGALGRSPATTAVHRPTPKPPGVEWPRRPTGCRSRFQLTDNPGIKPSGAERASASDPMVRMRSAHR